MFVVQMSLLVVTFLSLISRWILSSMQIFKEVNPQPRIAPCVNMWSVAFFFLCQSLNVGACICHMAREGQVQWSGPHQRRWDENEFKFHSVTYYTNLIVSCIHANTTKLCNITCTLVATGVILRSLECSSLLWRSRHVTWLPRSFTWTLFFEPSREWIFAYSYK